MDSQCLGRAARAEALEPRILLASFPVGGEFSLNDTPFSSASNPSAAANAQGEYVVTWSTFIPGDFREIFARRFNSSGLPQGGAFRVNTITTGHQEEPSVGIDADGDFVVAWRSYNQPGGNGIYARRFDAAGAPLGDQVLVSPPIPEVVFQPSVGVSAGGEFVVAWMTPGGNGSGNAIHAQAFYASGARRGNVLRVNSTTAGSQNFPAVAVAPGGAFVVAFNDYDGTDNDVHARRFGPTGLPQGDQWRVNTYTTGTQAGASVAIDGGGDFVITWSSMGQDGSEFGVYARRFDPAGAPQGAEFRVNTTTTGTQRSASVAAASDGGFVVTWEGRGRGGDFSGVHAQRFNAVGAPDGGEFRANTHTAGEQFAPSVAVDGDGDFLITWVSADTGPVAQRYRPLAASELATAGDRVWRDLDGDGVQGVGEPGLPDGLVELYAAAGAMAASATSDAGGRYSFPVPAGQSIYLRFAPPSGTIATRANMGTDDARDSDADRVTGLVAPFTLANPGDVNGTVDAGFLSPSSISGAVFSDLNANAVRDDGEPGVPGFVLFVDANGDGARQPEEPVAISGTDGGYEFADFLPDTYRVAMEDQQRWVEPGALDVVVPPERAVLGVDRAVRTTVRDTAAAPLGPEFIVNAPTTASAREPAIAMDADGDFVIAWVNFTTAPATIRAQRFSAGGVPQGDEIVVTDAGILVAWGPSVRPAVAMDADGDFVVAWPAYGASGNSTSVYGRRFNANGIPHSDRFLVNPAGNASDASVAMSDAGEFVVTWTSNFAGGGSPDVYARRYDAAGAPQDKPFRVNPYTPDGQSQPGVSVDADGDFVVAWSGAGPGRDNGIWVRRFLADGLPAGDLIRASADAAAYPASPGLSSDSDGNFVVAWRQLESGPTPPSIRVQRFSAAGVAQGAPIAANTSAVGYDGRPSVALDDDGDFVVAWQNVYARFSPTSAFYRRYSAAGVPQGGETRVTPNATAGQLAPAVALDADGDFVVTWATGSELFTNTISARRFAVAPSVVASAFAFATAPHRATFTFDRDVGASVGVEDLVLENLTTGQTIPVSDLAVAFDHSTNAATFRYTGNAGRERIDGVLPDGRYRATLRAGGVTTPNGAAMTADHRFEFRFLQADANADGLVNLRDFQILADNFHERGHDFTGGNFKYDAEGLVGLADFNILASRFGGAPPVPAVTPNPFAGEQRRGDSDDSLDGLLS